MTNDRLCLSYLKKANVRVKALQFYHDHKDYSDVIRETQEVVELLLKALLRGLGLEVPKVHDVSRNLQQNKDKLPPVILKNLDEITKISRQLRKDRELSFYGTEDWIPTDEYGEKESLEAIGMAKKILQWVEDALA